MSTALQMDLSEKIALITGAASGIGLAIAREMVQNGLKVCVADVDRDALEHCAKELRRLSSEILFVQADLRVQKDIRRVHSSILDSFGTVDILVNNAGMQFLSPVELFPVEKWDEIMDTMLRGAFLCAQEALPGMIAKGWGRIINIASIHSIVASPYKSAYISAKHGLLGLTKTLALEVALKGVTVNAISPSYVRTPLVEKQLQSQAKLHGISKDEVLEKIMLAPMPQKALIEPKEVSDCVFFLCSESARHINGHNLIIDGGWTAS